MGLGLDRSAAPRRLPLMMLGMGVKFLGGMVGVVGVGLGVRVRGWRVRVRWLSLGELALVGVSGGRSGVGEFAVDFVEVVRGVDGVGGYFGEVVCVDGVVVHYVGIRVLCGVGVGEWG